MHNRGDEANATTCSKIKTVVHFPYECLTERKVIIFHTFQTLNKNTHEVPILVNMASYHSLSDDVVRHLGGFTESHNPHPFRKYAGKGVYRLQQNVQPLRKVNKRSAQVLPPPTYSEFALDETLLHKRLPKDPDEREEMVNRLLYACIGGLPSTPLDAICFTVTRYWGWACHVNFRMNFTVNNLRATGDFSALKHFKQGHSAGLAYMIDPCVHFTSSDGTRQQGCSCECECTPDAPVKELVENILKLYMIVTA